MTTQIFLNIVRPAFIRLSQISLIIFDECHHGKLLGSNVWNYHIVSNFWLSAFQL